MVAKVARQRSRVDLAQPGDPVAPQLLLEGTLPTRMSDIGGELANHERAALDAARFSSVIAAAVITDERVRHHDDLTRIGRVGDDLLVAAHAGVEHHLAVVRVIERSADEHAFVRRPGFECKTPANIRHW